MRKPPGSTSSPGVQNLEHVREALPGARPSWACSMFPSAFSLTHVFAVSWCCSSSSSARSPSRRRRAKGGRDAIVPPSHVQPAQPLRDVHRRGPRLADGRHGREERAQVPAAHRHARLLHLLLELLALIPGFSPPTATLKTNVALALTVFVLTHVYGVMEQRRSATSSTSSARPVYLAPLMLPIELVSHMARPLSLSLRLLGNIAADHKVVVGVLRAGAAAGAGAVLDSRRDGRHRPDAGVLLVDDGLYPGRGGRTTRHGDELALITKRAANECPSLVLHRRRRNENVREGSDVGRRGAVHHAGDCDGVRPGSGGAAARRRSTTATSSSASRPASASASRRSAAARSGPAAAAALDGIARNPGASDKLFTPMILGLALIESLVIYSLVISIMLYLKIH